MKKKVGKKLKYVDPVVKSIHNFPLVGANALPNLHNNPRSSVHSYITNPSTYSCADQNLFSGQISH